MNWKLLSGSFKARGLSFFAKQHWISFCFLWGWRYDSWFNAAQINKSLASTSMIRDAENQLFWRDVTYDEVWWPILGICALLLTHPKCTHTAVNTHTTCTHIHTEQWAATYAAAPGEQLGVRCLAQGHLSRGIEGGECAVLSPPHLQSLHSLCLLKIAIAQIAHTHMKLHFKIFGLTINVLKYIVKDDKFVTKCYLDCDDAVKEKNIEKN